MDIVFYGVRGSYPVPDKNVLKYGGNTSSILIENRESIMIFDAGTGIISIGDYLIKKKKNIKKIDIFLTHLHFDHIQGLPFFTPFYDNNFKINIYCPYYPNISLKNVIYSIFNHPFSPISNKGIKANIKFFELNSKKNKNVKIDENIKVEFIKDDSHPISGVLIYKLISENKSIVYATDVESPKGFKSEIIDFIKGAEVLIHDAQYIDSEYYDEKNSKEGFGHSTVSMAIKNAIKCDVEKLFLFHYNPDRLDNDLERILKDAKKMFKNTFLSRELNKIDLRS
jgi:ribonuclease BN (tRNA processing enzyme)